MLTRMIGTVVSKLSAPCRIYLLLFLGDLVACAKYMAGLSDDQAEKLWTRGLFASLECCYVKVSRCDNAFCFQTYIIFGEEFTMCVMAQPTCSPPNVRVHPQEFRPEDKLKALRSISHLIFITCMHMRQMVGRLAPICTDGI